MRFVGSSMKTQLPRVHPGKPCRAHTLTPTAHTRQAAVVCRKAAEGGREGGKEGGMERETLVSMSRHIAGERMGVDRSKA